MNTQFTKEKACFPPPSSVTSIAWEVGFHRQLSEYPQEWMPASVPGAVQLDYAQAKQWPTYWIGNHFLDYAWMEDVFWTYRARLVAPPDIESGERLFLVLGGVDYRFRISLREDILHEQEGMFTPVELDLTEYLTGPSDLAVTLWPVPKSYEAPADRGQANRSCKPAVSYGWDFQARLIPSGIWKEARLERRPPRRIEKAEIFYELNADFSSVDIRLAGRLSGAGAAQKLEWVVFDPDSKISATSTQTFEGDFHFSATLAAPQLWWPHSHGKPVRYRAVVRMLDVKGTALDSRELLFGLRRVRLVMAQGVWKEPGSGFPKTRCNPPMTLEINGREIFAKGSNIVASDIFSGTITSDDHETLVGLAKQANFNLLRLWGGAATPTDTFFEACDREGIIVWAEFPLSCNAYGDEPEYLKVFPSKETTM